MLNLPKTTSAVESDKPRISVNGKLINQLRDACEYRSDLAMKLFQSEWTGIPECFVDKDCNPYHGKKSQLLESLEDDELRFHPKVEAIVVDMSVVTRAQASVITPGSTFNNLADGVLKYIVHLANECEANRVDIVLDQYNDLSIKYPTRCDRKSENFGYQTAFEGNSIIPRDISTFLSDELNKTNLNEFIVKRFLASSTSLWNKEFFITNGLTNVYTDVGERVIYTSDLISVLEEADNRMICHINDLICGYTFRTLKLQPLI